MTDENANNYPVKQYRSGPVRAAIWRTMMETDGRNWPRYNIKIEKVFWDKDEEKWRTTTYFQPRDLHHVEVVARRAFEFVSLREDEKQEDLPVEVE